MTVREYRDSGDGGGLYGVVYECRVCSVQFRGATALLFCAECGSDGLRIVARSRLLVVREMQSLERRQVKLRAMAAELRGLAYTDLAEQAENVVRLERARWWDRAAELGCGLGATVADIRQLVATVNAELRRHESA